MREEGGFTARQAFLPLVVLLDRTVWVKERSSDRTRCSMWLLPAIDCQPPLPANTAAAAALVHMFLQSDRRFLPRPQVMPSGLAQGGQHHLGQIQGHHQIMYQNVQPAQNATHVTHHQQQQQQQNHHSNHQQHQQGGHGGGGGGHGGGGHGKANKKKPKVNKDGVPAPKRATTAYINFTQWYREELKKAGRAIPKVSIRSLVACTQCLITPLLLLCSLPCDVDPGGKQIGDFGKECAAKWNGMPEDDKKPFLDVANKDRERYKREMQVYKPARDANKPKRPGTAFMLFMGDFRKEMAGKEPEGGVAALAKLGGERWRNMTEEDKRPYVERQNVEKQRYEIAMEDYRRKVTT